MKESGISDTAQVKLTMCASAADAKRPAPRRSGAKKWVFGRLLDRLETACEVRIDLRRQGGVLTVTLPAYGGAQCLVLHPDAKKESQTDNPQLKIDMSIVNSAEKRE